MDRLTAMASFVRVVERGSFAAAAAASGLSPAMVGNHVRYLEGRLGGPLLLRTTRRQALTELGQEYYERCRHILAEVEAADAAGGAHAVSPSGTLRVTAPVVLGTTVLAAPVARYVRENPGMRVELVLRDERLDLLSERIDVALRVGTLGDSTLVQRALAPLPLVMCATPDYLALRGHPTKPDDLDDHACLQFLTVGPSVWPLRAGPNVVAKPVSGPVRANSGEALKAFALADLGIAMAPRCVVEEELERGTLYEVLSDYAPEPLGLHLLTPRGRMSAPKVRRFVDLVSSLRGSSRR